MFRPRRPRLPLLVLAVVALLAAPAPVTAQDGTAATPAPTPAAAMLGGNAARTGEHFTAGMAAKCGTRIFSDLICRINTSTAYSLMLRCFMFPAVSCHVC